MANLDKKSNRPFAAGGHILVQNPTYWRTIKIMSDSKIKHNLLEKCEFSLLPFPSGVLSHSFALKYFGFCTL